MSHVCPAKKTTFIRSRHLSKIAQNCHNQGIRGKFFCKFVLLVKSMNIYQLICPFDTWQKQSWTIEPRKQNENRLIRVRVTSNSLGTNETEMRGRGRRSWVTFSISLFCLLNLWIFIDWYALLTHDRSNYEQLNPENKTKIDWLESELRAIL